MPSLETAACDICGCGVGSYYVGILPDFQKRFVGLRYQNKLLTSHLTPSGGRSYLTSDESYHSFETWGAVNIGKRFRVIGFVPVNFIQKQSNGQKQSKVGLGDVAFIGYFNLLKSESTTTGLKRMIHSFWLGGGVKAPTGRYSVPDSRTNPSLNTFQLGSGSIDFTTNAMYDVRLQDAGVNTNLSYKMNTRNRHQYRYGDKLSGNVLFYYKFRVGEQWSIAPNARVLFEASAKDMSASGIKVDLSGGHAALFSTGAEFRLGQLNIGGNFQKPFSQELASGVVRAGARWMLHVSRGF